MGKLTLIIAATMICLYSASAQEEFELEPGQGMLMTGKGPGQDGTINPYEGQDCYAIVENFGDVTFSIRIQKEGEVLETLSIAGMETKKFILRKDQELYIDCNEEQGTAKARVEYAKLEE